MVHRAAIASEKEGQHPPDGEVVGIGIISESELLAGSDRLKQNPTVNGPQGDCQVGHQTQAGSPGWASEGVGTALRLMVA